MMKKMIYVLACITSILFFACSSNESIIVEENKAVEMEFLSKSIKEDTRVTIVPENDQFSINWEATGDAVGIFANAIDSNGAITVLGSNKRYNATPRDIVSECDFVPNETTDKIYWRYHRNHNLYAYFPHTEGQDNPSAIQTTLPAHQAQTVPDPLAHVSELSFMTAAAIEREMNNFEQVNFQFTSLY